LNNTHKRRNQFVKQKLKWFRILRFRAIDLSNLKPVWRNRPNHFVDSLLQQSKMAEWTKMYI